jgi:surface polysaccharide O-acyltransferase-like enzyme
MISGALLLQPKAARDPGAFLGRRLGKVLVPLVFWSAFYLWFRQSVLGQRMTIWRALDDIAAGHPFLQLYFLFIIVGLYFVTPILARLVHDGRREFATVTFGALLFGVLDQTVQSFAGKGGVNALTWFVPYVGYYLAGRLLRDVQLSRRRVTLAGLGFLLSVAAIVLGTALGIAVGDRTLGVYLFSYLSPAVVVMSVSAYLLFRALPLGRVPAATLRRLGNATFGVFLLHPVLLFPPLLHLGWPSSVLGVALGVPAIAVGVTAASLAIALLASRVPVVRALV